MVNWKLWGRVIAMTTGLLVSGGISSYVVAGTAQSKGVGLAVILGIILHVMVAVHFSIVVEINKGSGGGKKG